jgi:hypothetical protein
MWGLKPTVDRGFVSNFKEIYIPFHKLIPAGQSTFSVKVPNYHTDRDLFFSYLELTTALYSEQAAKLNLDTDEELQQVLRYFINYKLALNPDQPLFPLKDNITIPVTVVNSISIMNKINNYFELKKPVGLVHLGMFIDWYDEKFDTALNLTWDEFVQKVMAEEYYGKEYDPNLHYNKLPASARSVPGANNYLFPTNLSQSILKTIRFRINIAPNVNIVCSTDGQLLDMGFDADQLGPRTGRKKIVFSNPNVTGFQKIMAFNEPNIVIIPKNPLNIFLDTIEPNYATAPFSFAITTEKSYTNLNYKELAAAMQKYSYSCNFILGFSYDATTKVFRFEFPNNTSLENITVVIPPELAERLGFGLQTDITRNNNTGKKVEDEFDVSKTQDKARALAFDTSLVIVSNNDSSSMTTVGINDTYMAALYPTGLGSMVIPAVEYHFKPPTMKLSKTLYGSDGFVNANFKLSRFLDNSTFVNFVWNKGAYISGVLRGAKPLS